METRNDRVTPLLAAWRQGDEQASEQVAELVYDELRRLAARRLAGERRNHTLQPTELVNETFLRLLAADVPWADRVHFFAAAALAMRRVLVDHARRRNREKRGSGAAKVTLGESHGSTAARAVDVVVLDRALDALTALDADQARLVELYFFSGLTFDEIASVTGISRSAVHRQVRSGQAWLYRRLVPSSEA